MRKRKSLLVVSFVQPELTAEYEKCIFNYSISMMVKKLKGGMSK